MVLFLISAPPCLKKSNDQFGSGTFVSETYKWLRSNTITKIVCETIIRPRRNDAVM